MDEFLEQICMLTDELDLLDYCRKRMLHGTPEIFLGREGDFYEFSKRIASKFEIGFHEVFITGSAKLGFSPFKRKAFDLESDVDVAIISSALYERIMVSIHGYQMELRENRKSVSTIELDKYHKFLEYAAIGWMRPDLLPTSFRVSQLKRDWFDFFDSISHGKSEAGNYKVNAGVFKSYWHLESYTFRGLKALRTRLQVGAFNANSN
jgi:hypothetical protein